MIFYCFQVRIERENNFKEYKLSHDLDTMPKFGAGSEYGRDLKEEARRKKYGINRKKYNPEDQPWLLRMGDGKQIRRFGGRLAISAFFFATLYRLLG